jgi:predicted transcriptional regulator
MKGEDLKSWRKKWGVTQVELAKMLGTYQETISRWEKGKRGIPSHLGLALEALEHRIREGGKIGRHWKSRTGTSTVPKKHEEEAE